MDEKKEIKVTLTIKEIAILMLACDKASNEWHRYGHQYFSALATATEKVRAKLEAKT
jgi:hypothetical protein